jgi:hypothetical protein
MLFCEKIKKKVGAYRLFYSDVLFLLHLLQRNLNVQQAVLKLRPRRVSIRKVREDVASEELDVFPRRSDAEALVRDRKVNVLFFYAWQFDFGVLEFFVVVHVRGWCHGWLFFSGFLCGHVRNQPRSKTSLNNTNARVSF